MPHPIKLSLLAGQSHELSEALTLLARASSGSLEGRLPNALAGNRVRGRKSRAEQGAALAANAPFPELVTYPARRLTCLLRTIEDCDLLRHAHAFEVEHLRRQTVLEALEERLRLLGQPLGGPKEVPVLGYELLDEDQVLELLGCGSAELAVKVYAWEFYHRRRQRVLFLAKGLGGEECSRLVEATRPPRGPELREPFPGFSRLSTAPSARFEVRKRLSELNRETLAGALAYERQTRRRTTMIAALEKALSAYPDEAESTGATSVKLA